MPVSATGERAVCVTVTVYKCSGIFYGYPILAPFFQLKFFLWEIHGICSAQFFVFCVEDTYIFILINKSRNKCKQYIVIVKKFKLLLLRFFQNK